MDNVDRVENIDVLEVACKYVSKELSDFKDILSSKVETLEKVDWIYDKGTTKACQLDEKNKRKRCKVGVTYNSKVEISADYVEIIWKEFYIFFKEKYMTDIERLYNNEKIGRYEFIATNSKGDSISCKIYLSGEWNIPQISLLAFVADRYKKDDL